MKDHTPNCEIRIFGTQKCTCGAVEENYLADTRLAPPGEATNQPLKIALAMDSLKKAAEPIITLAIKNGATPEAALDMFYDSVRPQS